MSEFDHEHVSHLLNIVAQCAGHSGKLGSLSNAAMAELLELNAKIKEQGVARQKQAEANAAVQATDEDVEETIEDDDTLPPSTHPKGSKTATIADNNARRV